MTEDDTYTDVIEHGERYELINYGEVLVTDLSCRIDAVDADGVAEDTILVRFNKNPQKGLHHGQGHGADVP